MVTEFEHCLALALFLCLSPASFLSLYQSSPPPHTHTHRHPHAFLFSHFLSLTSHSPPTTPLLSHCHSLSQLLSPFLFLSLALSFYPHTPPPPLQHTHTHTHSITVAANGTAPSNQTRLHNELVMQRPVVAELVLQHQSRQISFMHKKKERESKLKIVDGGWEWRWRWRRKKQKSRTTVASNCKKKVVLCNNLIMAHSSMLHTNDRTKEDTVVNSVSGCLYSQREENQISTDNVIKLDVSL